MSSGGEDNDGLSPVLGGGGPWTLDCSSTCVCLLGDDAAVVRIIFTSQLNPLTAIVSFKVADPKPAHSALWDFR